MFFPPSPHKQIWEMFQFNLRREVWEQYNADWWVRGCKHAFEHLLVRLPVWFLFISRPPEKPFYLKEVYLPTNCTDCLVVYEEVNSGQDTFTSLLLFSRTRLPLRPECVVRTDLKRWFQPLTCDFRQEKERLICCCGRSQKKSKVSQDVFTYNRRLKLRSDNAARHALSHHAMHTFANASFTCVYTDICPEDIPPSEGLSALNTLFEAKMGHRVARLLDTLFDILVNWIIIQSCANLKVINYQ